MLSTSLLDRSFQILIEELRHGQQCYIADICFGYSALLLFYWTVKSNILNDS